MSEDRAPKKIYNRMYFQTIVAKYKVGDIIEIGPSQLVKIIDIDFKENSVTVCKVDGLDRAAQQLNEKSKD